MLIMWLKGNRTSNTGTLDPRPAVSLFFSWNDEQKSSIWNLVGLGGLAHGIVTKTVHKTLSGGGGCGSWWWVP